MLEGVVRAFNGNNNDTVKCGVKINAQNVQKKDREDINAEQM